MADQPRQKWGITNPISELPPTDADLKLNDRLIEYLKEKESFETPAGMDNRCVACLAARLGAADTRRTKVLAHIQKVAEEFIRRVGRERKLSQSALDSLGGKVFTYGSYQLGVYGPSMLLPIPIAMPMPMPMPMPPRCGSADHL